MRQGVVAASSLCMTLLGALLALTIVWRYDWLQMQITIQRFRVSAVQHSGQDRVHRMKALVAKLSSIIEQQRKQVLTARSIGVWRTDPGPWMPMTATWYTGNGGINGDGVTAVGRSLQNEWTVATDPSVIPLGSVVEIQFSNGREEIAQALDTGGAIHGRRMDIYEPSNTKALENGIQQVEVRILVNGREGSQ